MLTKARSAAAKADIKTRQHLMERTFARAKRYGYKRARWRRLWRVQIQEYITASIQNIMVLLANAKKPAEGAKIQTQHSYYKAYAAFQQQFGY
jgi:Tfp pilus assembly protein PilE